MRAAVRPHARATLVVLGLLVHGCEGCQERRPEEAPVGVPEAQAPEVRPAPQRRGVKVPMPPGWTAQVAADGSFQFGPPGRPVLRVDLRPGQGPKLPSPDELKETLEKSFQGFERSLHQEEGGDDSSLLLVGLAPKLADGGVGADHPALFGAKRVEEDLFLCATFPGVTADEVRQATEACRGIEFQPPR